MDHQAKVAHLLEDLKQRGISEYTTAPPFYRLLWRMGLETPPPHFASFGSIALTLGVFFGVGWGLLMWFPGLARGRRADRHRAHHVCGRRCALRRHHSAGGRASSPCRRGRTIPPPNERG